MNSGPGQSIVGQLGITSSIFSGNSARAGGGIFSFGLSSIVTTADNDNVFFNNTGGHAFGFGTLANDLVGKDPILALLGDYGGPTQTMIPLPGSAAICAASLNGTIITGPIIDQRGYPNSKSSYQGGLAGISCEDAGSVQTDYALEFSAQPPASVAAGTAFSAAVTLRESGNIFTGGAVQIPLTLVDGANGALSNGSAITVNGIANYTNLSVSAAGNGDMLLASLTMNQFGPSTVISAESDPFGAAAGTQSQTITFSNPGTQTAGTTVSLSATASSGLSVSFASTTTDVCTVSGSRATLITAGACSITASQPGNGTYAGATPVIQSFTVTTAILGFAISGTNVEVAPGATTGNSSTITVTPSGGFTGAVSLSAVITSSPNGAQYLPHLSFGGTNPVNINGSGFNTATLTISTTAPNTGALEYPSRPKGSWYAAAPAALACLLFLGMPTRRRRWSTMAGLIALMATLAVGALSCGGSGGTGGGGGGTPGTTAGNYTITVTGASGNATASGTLSLTVE